MSISKTFKCTECGYEYVAIVGWGSTYPYVYEEVSRNLWNGVYGADWKELFESITNCAVNAEPELYVCPSCSFFECRPNLSIYEPDNPTKRYLVQHPEYDDFDYVWPLELEELYHLVKTYTHVCPDCGDKMRKFSDNDMLKCPKCGHEWMELIKDFFWH